MINTPMLFCRLCNAENPESLDICPYCGTPNMMKEYEIAIKMVVPVDAYTYEEAVHDAIAVATNRVLEYVVDVYEDNFDDYEEQ